MMSTEKTAAENVMRYDLREVDQKYYYRNEIDFPLVADMDEAILLIVSRAVSWKKEGNRVIIQTEADFYKKRYFYRFLDFRATYDLMDRKRSVCVTLTVYSGDIIRIQAAQGFNVPNRTSEMLVNNSNSEVKNIDINETGDAIILETKSLRVTVMKDPWNITIYDKEKNKLFSQHTSSRMQEPAVMKYEQCPFGFLYDPANDVSYTAEQIEIQPDEHFYGFGEKFMALDKKGQNIDLWNTNCLGCNTTRTYKNIPFFMSTRGYGLFLHTSCAVNANMGQHFSKAYGLLTGDDVIDYFFINGPSFRQILSRYTDLTGKTPLPPKWSFGFWISKISYRTQNEIEILAKRFRKEAIPCDVIHIDTDWYEYPWVCDYEFSKSRFPNVAQMVKEAAELGYRISLWQMTYIDNDGEHPNKVWVEGFRKGYFAARPDGQSDFPHGLIDLGNPEAVAWYQDKLLRPLLELGFAAIKVDFGESIPQFYQYCGIDSKKMHNLYPLLYNKIVYDITAGVRGKDDAVIWARSTWAGSQRYPVHWAGDPDVDFHALAATIRGGLSFGLSGFPFWSHDIGGFNAPAIPEVYARWMQVGCFSSHTRAHGFETREPWDFGPEVQAIAKKYLQLRYRLLPYIYSQAYTCVRESLPMFRALILDYQDDENVYHIDDEYLFGDNFLVAPILDSRNKRRVYLPKGTWTDFWTEKKISGGQWISVEAPLDTLPVYVRENAIIPIGPVINYADEKPDEPWDLEIYPAFSGRSEFLMYRDSAAAQIDMTINGSAMELNIERPFNIGEIRIHSIEPRKVSVNGNRAHTDIKGNITVINISDLCRPS